MLFALLSRRAILVQDQASLSVFCLLNPSERESENLGQLPAQQCVPCEARGHGCLWSILVLNGIVNFIIKGLTVTSRRPDGTERSHWFGQRRLWIRSDGRPRAAVERHILPLQNCGRFRCFRPSTS